MFNVYMKAANILITDSYSVPLHFPSPPLEKPQRQLLETLHVFTYSKHCIVYYNHNIIFSICRVRGKRGNKAIF